MPDMKDMKDAMENASVSRSGGQESGAAERAESQDPVETVGEYGRQAGGAPEGAVTAEDIDGGPSLDDKKDGDGDDKDGKKKKDRDPADDVGRDKKDKSKGTAGDDAEGGDGPPGDGGGDDKSPLTGKKKKSPLAKLAKQAAMHGGMMAMQMAIKLLLLQLLMKLLQWLAQVVAAIVNTVVNIIMAVVQAVIAITITVGLTIATGGMFLVVLGIGALIAGLISMYDATSVAMREPADPCDEAITWTMEDGVSVDKEVVAAKIYVALKAAGWDQYHIAAVLGNMEVESSVGFSTMEISNVYGYSRNTTHSGKDTESAATTTIRMPVTKANYDANDMPQYQEWLKTCLQNPQPGTIHDGHPGNGSLGPIPAASHTMGVCREYQTTGATNSLNANGVKDNQRCDCTCTYWSHNTVHPGSWTRIDTSTCPHGKSDGIAGSGSALSQKYYHTSAKSTEDLGIQCYLTRSRTCWVDAYGVHHWGTWSIPTSAWLLDRPNAGTVNWHHAYHLANFQTGCWRQRAANFVGKSHGGYIGIGLAQWTGGRHRKLMEFAYGTAGAPGYPATGSGNIYWGRSSNIWDKDKDGDPMTDVEYHKYLNAAAQAAGQPLHWYDTELQMAFLLQESSEPLIGADRLNFMKYFVWNSVDTYPWLKTGETHQAVDLNYLTKAWMIYWERPSSMDSLGERQAFASMWLSDYIGPWWDKTKPLPTGVDETLGADILTLADSTATVAGNIGSSTDRNECSTGTAANNSSIATAAVSFAWPHSEQTNCKSGMHTAAQCSYGNDGTPLYQCVMETIHHRTVAQGQNACSWSAIGAVRWAGASSDTTLSMGCSTLFGQLGTNGEFTDVTSSWISGTEEGLQPGDILCCSHHIVLYVGHDTVVQVYGSDPHYSDAVADESLVIVGASTGGDDIYKGPPSRSAALEVLDATTAEGYRVFRSNGSHVSEEWVNVCKDGYGAGYP